MSIFLGPGYRFADKGFLFTIKNYDNITVQTKFPLANKEKAAYMDSNSLGFGDGDFRMERGFVTSSLGSSYNASELTTEQKQRVLGGSKMFGLTQMEVFYMGNYK